MPEGQLNVLWNEARRQRTLDMIALRGAVWGGKEVCEALEDGLKAHGPYTEGFYEEERKRLKEALGGARRKDRAKGNS